MRMSVCLRVTTLDGDVRTVIDDSLEFLGYRRHGWMI